MGTQFKGKPDESVMDFIFKNMGDAVCVLDAHGVLYYMNDAAKSLLRAPKEMPQNSKMWKMIPYVEANDDLIQLFIDATMEKHVTHHRVVDYENNDGDRMKLSVNITYTTNDDSTYLVVVMTNLTELFKVNAAFRRYTSAEIAEYVLNTPEGEKQGGVSKDVSILMSDLRGFTALSTKMTPDELITLLNHYFAIMAEIIVSFRGTVIEFLGDGIFVVFGAPKDDPDHATTAVRCAIEMENAMDRVNEWNAENGYPELKMGIGINSGKAVVGNIGSESKMKYGCMGETVNIAGRVESFTVGGQIYISEYTKALLKEEVKVRDTQSFMPKGARKEIEIFSIEGLGELDLKLSSEEIKWRGNIDKDVSFQRLSGKAVLEEVYTGVIKDLSEDLENGLLKTDAPLSKMENIMMDIGGDLYAKVMSGSEEGYILTFTSKPEEFKTFFKLA